MGLGIPVSEQPSGNSLTWMTAVMFLHSMSILVTEGSLRNWRAIATRQETLEEKGELPSICRFPTEWLVEKSRKV